MLFRSKVYYEGLVKNVSYFLDRLDDTEGAIDEAMIGKYDHTSAVEVVNVKNIIEHVR